MKSKPTKMQSCSCCFEDWIGPCNGPYENVTINTALMPGGVYHYRITDKFGKIYQNETIADLDGKIVIPCSELPDFLFTPYSGSFTIEILDNGCKPINFLMASEYSCITMTINGGNADKHSIGCEMEITAGGGSGNAMLTFTDADELVINWAAYIDTFGNDPLIQVYQQEIYDPTVYALVTVEILQLRNGSGVLQEIQIDFGGSMTGYILITG